MRARSRLTATLLAGLLLAGWGRVDHRTSWRGRGRHRDPERIEVEAGEVVTFQVTNTGEAVHEFFIGDAAMQQEHADEMAEMGHDMAHDEPNSISLDPGETKQLTWQFGDSGSVEFACHEPGHYGAGMLGLFIVS